MSDLTVYVRIHEHDGAQAIIHSISAHMHSLGIDAFFRYEDGQYIRENDGTWMIQVYSAHRSRLVEFLKQYDYVLDEEKSDKPRVVSEYWLFITPPQGETLELRSHVEKQLRLPWDDKGLYRMLLIRHRMTLKDVMDLLINFDYEVMSVPMPVEESD